MLSKNRISTKGDAKFYQIFSCLDGQDFANDLNYMLKGTKRTTAFTNENVVATVAYMSHIGMIFKEINQPDFHLKYQVLITLFATSKMSWMEFVTSFRTAQSQFLISKEFSDELINHVEVYSKYIMKQIPIIYGDYC